jgi:hypothetical protein
MAGMDVCQSRCGIVCAVNHNQVQCKPQEDRAIMVQWNSSGQRQVDSKNFNCYWQCDNKCSKT